MVKKGRRWTEDELRDLGCGKHLEKVAGKGRYGNVKKIEEDGIRFDSKREYLRYRDLKLLEKAGEIVALKVHPKFPIIIGGVEVRIYSKRYHKNGRQMIYEADFLYWRVISEVTGLPCSYSVIEDVKMQSGHLTEVYKIKRALMKAMGHDIKEY
jgi:hypothetical protein